MQRLNLRTQIVRHRRTVRFVVLEQFITEGFAFRVKHHGRVGRLVLQYQASQHIQHAIHRAGGLASAVGQRRKRVIRPIQVRRAIDENKGIFWDLNHNVRA